ncbi:MAG: cyclodeaminase/cyclohydrolase family protein [Firmicutes bacterium]|jgi:formiminotetrahydrofolate cyclodeaminase|nr:cyclodeaminase/cyclohydrolase family protein [Bacillota bacterium]
MKLIDLKVNEYLDILKSDAPAPGGGSVSALAGAQAVGLMMMVADLTIGKEKYADYQDICQKARARGAELYTQLAAAIDKDTDAFNLVSAAFKMPKGTPEEKATRSKAIADGTLVATEVPYSVMQLAHEAMLLAETMVGKSNPNAASDLGVCVLNLMAAIKGAWLNVKINLPGVKDETKAKAFEEGGQKIYDEAEAIARRLYDEVLKQL